MKRLTLFFTVLILSAFFAVNDGDKLIGNWEIQNFMRIDSSAFTLYPSLSTKDSSSIFTLFCDGSLSFNKKNQFQLNNPIFGTHKGKWNLTNHKLVFTIKSGTVNSLIDSISPTKYNIKSGPYQFELVKQLVITPK